MNDQELSRMVSLENIAQRYADEAAALRVELQRFREREPLVQELLEAADDLGDELYPIMQEHDYNMRQNYVAAKRVRDFGRCIVGASTDAPAAADLAHAKSIGATESLKKASDNS